MKAALNQAQAMVTGEMSWDETAWEWVTKGWEMRLAELIAAMLNGLVTRSRPMSSPETLAKAIGDFMKQKVFEPMPHLDLSQLGEVPFAQWNQTLAKEFYAHECRAVAATQRTLGVKHAGLLLSRSSWDTKAPALLAGSLAFATAIVGN